MSISKQITISEGGKLVDTNHQTTINTEIRMRP